MIPFALFKFAYICMILKSLQLSNFRNHGSKKFKFEPTTIIIGKNTAGKTNILEALHILSHGKSFRAENDRDTIQDEKDFLRIESVVENKNSLQPQNEANQTKLAVIFANKNNYLSKKFLVNNIARRHLDFAANFSSVLFTPEDIEIITASPGIRRKYIDSILSLATREYRQALGKYEKGLRQRNRMLSDIKNGRKFYKREDFDFWDNILIENAKVLTEKRGELVEFVNKASKQLFDFSLIYDKSLMSLERLFKYHFEERAAGVTLVGPQRDDYVFNFPDSDKKISEFGSRGQERLTILQMKLLEIEFLKEAKGDEPVLLLDDIFSELDEDNIFKIFSYISGQQTIITTTHREFIPKKILKQESLEIIEL